METLYTIRIGTPVFNNYDAVCATEWETKAVTENELKQLSKEIWEDDYAVLELTFCDIANKIPALNTLDIDEIW